MDDIEVVVLLDDDDKTRQGTHRIGMHTVALHTKVPGISLYQGVKGENDRVSNVYRHDHVYLPPETLLILVAALKEWYPELFIQGETYEQS